MFEKYISQVQQILPYVDTVMITDKRGMIQYFHTNQPERTKLNSDKVVGRYVTEIYFSMANEASTLMNVLKTGKMSLNRAHRFVTFEGIVVRAITSDVPIFENGKVIGVINISIYDRDTAFVSKNNIKHDRDLYSLKDIVSISCDILELKDKIRKTANTDSSVIIYGETGTGKELVAQSIHTSGNRCKKPFISQNCSAIPASLLESTLFGTVKGSFTGAEDRKGLFEKADGGTLFLDEINSMELSVQAKLLKAIEQKQFTRVGDSNPIHVDVKIISASNENMDDLVANKKLRADLMYRLSVVRLNISPLRKRMLDIVPLTRYFVNWFNIKMNKHIVDVDDEVYELFTGYDWPGNVRELRSAIESAFNTSNGNFIVKNDLPDYLIRVIRLQKEKQAINYSLSLKEMVEEFEKNVIKETLNICTNKAEAAEKLKTTKQVLNYKLNKYKLNE